MNIRKVTPKPKNFEESNSKDKVKNKSTKQNNKKKKGDDDDFLANDSSFSLDDDVNKKSKPSKKSKEPKIKKEAKLASSAKKKTKKDKEEENTIIGPLSGYLFVITGVIEGIKRDDLTNYIKILGGKTPSKISGKTTYLVTSDYLEDGREYTQGNKYKEALAKGIKTLNLTDFNTVLGKILNIEDFDIYKADLKTGKYQGKEYAELFSDEESETVVKEKEKPKVVDNHPSLKSNHFKNYTIWSEKYKPTKIDDVVGGSEVINKLKAWLNDWNDVVLNGNKKSVVFKGRSQRPENVNARACLISGPPGIGKTTIARIMSKELGYTIFEQNASDQRNKLIINKIAGYLQDSTTINFKNDLKETNNTKNIMIMDEIDGTGGNEDRGGISALIQILKNTKIPIICICNDDQSQKLKSLKNSTYNIKFNRPAINQVVKRLKYICNQESIKAEENALEKLVEITDRDIRQCISFLEFFSRQPKSSNEKLEFKYSYFSNNKNLKDTSVLLNNFQSAGKILNPLEMKSLSHIEKMNLYFIDPDFIPLLVQENYLKCFKAEESEKSKKLEQLYNISQAADSISYADTLDTQIRKNNHWSLAVDKGVHGCLAVSNYAKNGLNPGEIEFSQIFAQMAKQKKTIRILRELKSCFSCCSNKAINEEISPLLLKIILKQLKNGPEAAENVSELINDLKFNSTLFRESYLDLMKDGLNKRLYEDFEKIPATTKSALTRKLNERMKVKGITNNKKKEKINNSDSEFIDEEDETELQEIDYGFEKEPERKLNKRDDLSEKSSKSDKIGDLNLISKKFKFLKIENEEEGKTKKGKSTKAKKPTSKSKTKPKKNKKELSSEEEYDDSDESESSIKIKKKSTNKLSKKKNNDSDSSMSFIIEEKAKNKKPAKTTKAKKQIDDSDD